MQRIAVDLTRGGFFHERAEVHHSDPVGDVPNDREVVGDDDVGEPELLLQLLQEVEHLGLHRDVEGRDRFVGDDEFGIDAECAGDADPLPLPAGELVGILAQGLRREPDRFEQLHEPFPAGTALREVVRPHPFQQQLLHGLAGVEAAEGILEDHLHVPALPSQRLALELEYVHTIEVHLARGRLLQVEHRAPERRFTAPGLPDEPVGLSPVDGHVHAVDRADVAHGLVENQPPLDGEVHFHVPV